MSILIHESAVSPDKNLWLGGAGIPASVAGTTASPTFSGAGTGGEVYMNYITQVAPNSGSYVIQGNFTYQNLSAFTRNFNSILKEVVSGSAIAINTAIPAGLTYSVPLSYTVNVVKGQTVTLRQSMTTDDVSGVSKQAGSWSVMFFPNTT